MFNKRDEKQVSKVVDLAARTVFKPETEEQRVKRETEMDAAKRKSREAKMNVYLDEYRKMQRKTDDLALRGKIKAAERTQRLAEKFLRKYHEEKLKVEEKMLRGKGNL